MGKKTEISDSKEPLEIPQKLGFGRNGYDLTTATETKIEYLKSGRGAAEELALLVGEIKTCDPEATLEARDKAVKIGLSRPFDVRSYRNPRRRLEATERERKRLEKAIEALIEAEADEELSDEEFTKRKEAFPAVVKYQTEDQEEIYRRGNELWIEDVMWGHTGTLIYCLVKDRYGPLDSEEKIKKLHRVIEFVG